MTVNEAIKNTQGRAVGMMNRASAQYAQSLLLPEENIEGAVVANIATRGERFPGVVVLTDRRVMAVCGLPGIKRSISYDLDALKKCEETPTAIHYKATFATDKNAFSLTIDPEIGEKFSRHIAVLRGEEEEFDAIGAAVADNGIFNPTLVRNKARARKAKSKERAKRVAEREEARVRLAAEQKERSAEIRLGAEGETTQEVALRLARELDEAKAKGQVSDTDPKAVAARLAAELAAEEAEENASE